MPARSLPSVLIVDDDPLIRRACSAILSNHGHRVHVAPDGEAALQWLASNEVDIVLIDIVMPRREGLETILELKRRHTALKVYAMSGSRKGSDFLIIAETFGADGTLQKPFTPEALVALIRSGQIGDPAVSAAVRSLGGRNTD